MPSCNGKPAGGLYCLSSPPSRPGRGEDGQPRKAVWAPGRRQRRNHRDDRSTRPPVLRPQSSLRSFSFPPALLGRQRDGPCVPGSTQVLQAGGPGLLGLCALLSPFLSSLLSALSTPARVSTSTALPRATACPRPLSRITLGKAASRTFYLKIRVKNVSQEKCHGVLPTLSL